MKKQVFSRPVDGALFLFSEDRREDGHLWRIHARRVHPSLGLLLIEGWVGNGHSIFDREIWVKCVAGGRIVDVRIKMWFSESHRPTFARQFNRYVMPELDAIAAKIRAGVAL